MSVVDDEFVTVQPDDTATCSVESHSSATVDRNDQQLTSYFIWKNVLDRMIAAILLIPGLPLIALLMAIVRLTSRGSAIFRQKRVGLDGKTYVMFKIRSMAHDAEDQTGPVWTAPNDLRVTRVGRILRKLHLDELPQLFNVLRGEMSLVGPRPERPEFVRVLDDAIDGYSQRHVIRPGITGLAQINLPPDTDIDSVRKKQQLDLEYIKSASFLLDCRMLICTMLRMFGLSGAVAMGLLRLKRTVKPLPTEHPVDGDCLTPDRISKSTVGPRKPK